MIVGVVVVGAGLFGRALPAGFIPDEDQGIIGVNVQLPPGASLERTSAVLTRVEEILGEDRRGSSPTRRSAGTGPSPTPTSRTSARIFVRLKPWDERKGAALHAKGIMAAAAGAVRRDPRGGHLPVQHPDHLGLRRLVGLQVSAPGPERHARRSSSSASGGPQVHRGGAPAAGARQPLHLLRSELSPGQGGARPREGAQARRADQRGVPGDVGGDGRQLRQRLQPVRAAVPGLRAGGGRVPPEAGGHRQTSTSAATRPTPWSRSPRS